jgi:peptidyl-prolyl cis-trans isomerase SDCCAG10
MSTVYNIEPQPTAKVLLETTGGDILLELFGKQTPLASRNFIQLCLEGYYNDTIFHRLVPGFVIQGGDPTGTGDGGESVYDGGVFEDEFHSRLKFNRRGLLGMANSGTKNDNGSQFFLTLGKTEELTNKNTMFGRIVGDTIYNLMKMAEGELVEGEGSERPLYPTKITKTEVLLNPFDDIVPRKIKQVEYSAPIEKSQPKKGKKKASKALLSFGGDDEEADAAAPVLKKAKFNPKLVAAGSPLEKAPSVKRDTGASMKRARRASSSPPLEKPEPQPPERQLPIRNEESPSRSPSESSEPEQVIKMTSLLDRTNAEIAKVKQSMKRDVPSATDSKSKPKSALEQMIPGSATRGRKRKHANAASNGDDTVAIDLLNKFRARLDQASSLDQDGARHSKQDAKSTSKGNDAGADQDEEAQLCDLHFIVNCQSCARWDDPTLDAQDESEDDSDWMNHSLVFERDHLGKDLSWKKKNEEELVVIDPREKAKDIMAEQKAKKAAKSSGHRIRDAARDTHRGRSEGRTK